MTTSFWSNFHASLTWYVYLHTKPSMFLLFFESGGKALMEDEIFLKAPFEGAVWALKYFWLRIFLQWAVIALQQVYLPSQHSRLKVRANRRERQGGKRERGKLGGGKLRVSLEGTHKCRATERAVLACCRRLCLFADWSVVLSAPRQGISPPNKALTVCRPAAENRAGNRRWQWREIIRGLHCRSVKMQCQEFML